MTKAINTHKYKEAVNTKQTWIPTGTKSYFWGLVTVPQGIIHEEKIRTGKCIICWELEFTEIHGHYKIDGFSYELPI